MSLLPDEIAHLVLTKFDSLEQKRKPLNRSDGVKEWVPLSGIVAQSKSGLSCLAISTGMKCLPQNKISKAQGVTLHDWHAEVLAIRLLNRFLLEECQALISNEKQSSKYIRLRDQSERTESHFQPFALHDHINLHMYCSEAPCGDASMELTMALQDDSTPWIPPSTSIEENEASQPLLSGRSYFSSLGQVRRKPSRPDAPPTLSKSCTDKLCLKQCTSLLSSTTSLLISPQNVYLRTLILPSSQISQDAMKRAFSGEGRMEPFTDPVRDKSKWQKSGYTFRPLTILPTKREFKHSRRQQLLPNQTLASSNISAAWTPHFCETLIGGTIQGRKQFSMKGASRVCKRRTWKLAACVALALGEQQISKVLGTTSYKEVKANALLSDRKSVKEEVQGVLKNWIKNDEGDDFTMEDVEV